MKKWKKGLCLLLTLCLLLPWFPIKARAVTIASGKCGDNLTWTLDDGGTLTISGTGDMTDYSSSTTVPWYSHRAKISTVAIDPSVTSIGSYAFCYCTSLTSITIPDSVTSLGDYCFEGCDSLTSITLPDSVTSLGIQCFYGCSSLTSITIPDSVTSLGIQCFYGCSSLTSITLPDRVTSLGNGCFSHCTSLTSITLPDSVTSLGDRCFSCCTSLTSITIPDSVTSLGEDCFSCCTSLKHIWVNENNPNYSSMDGILFNKNRTKIVAYPGGRNGHYTVLQGVTTLESSCFQGCVNLTSITLPDSVTNLGWRCFYNCDSLTDVYYGGTEEQWNTITVGSGNEVLETATIHYNSQMPEDPDAPRIDLETDVWSFDNFTIKLDKKYWKVLFPGLDGDFLYYFYKKNTPNNGAGVCTGMAVSAGAMNRTTTENGTEVLVQGAADFSQDTIAQIHETDISNALNIRAWEYVSILHTSQKKSSVIWEEKSNRNDLDALYQAVKKYDAYAGNIVTIGIKGISGGQKSGHTLLGIKAYDYDDRVEILVYDSNWPNQERYIKLYKDERGTLKSWEYNLWYGVTWSSSGQSCEITFNTKSEEMGDLVYSKLAGKSRTTFGSQSVQEDTLLMLLSQGVISDDSLLEIDMTPGVVLDGTQPEQNPENSRTLYWATGDSFQITNDNGLECDIVKSDIGFSVNSDTADSAVIDLAQKNVTVDSDSGDVVELSVLTYPGQRNVVTVSGEADGKISASATDSGMTFTGVPNAHLVYETEDTQNEIYIVSKGDEPVQVVVDVENGEIAPAPTTDNHTHSYTHETTAPTCTGRGYTTHTCATCGLSYSDEYVEALGHDWDDGKCTRCDVVLDNPFSDVPAAEWYTAPVLWAVENEITNGMGDGTFGVNLPCNRAQVVTFLWRSAGSPEPSTTTTQFRDVDVTKWYGKPVLWAVENGITNGISTTEFGIDQPCNRATVVTFLWRVRGEPAPVSNVSPFTDVPAGKWFTEPVLWAVENGITNGMGDGTFGINGICNRAQVVTFLYRTFAQ